MKEVGEMLFCYLRDLLYFPDRAEIDVSVLPPEFQEMGQGLQTLADWVREVRDFSKGLAKGDFTLEIPGGENVLIAPMKELQASLRHLIWQTQQVAKGDYDQLVEFMGDFDHAFNAMTKQLKERTENLMMEKKLIEEKKWEIERNLEVIMELIDHTRSMVFVFSREEGSQLFVSHTAEHFMSANRYADRMVKQLIDRQRGRSTESEEWEIDIRDETDVFFYRVKSISLFWPSNGRHQDREGGRLEAVAHIVEEESEWKQREERLYRMAYQDFLTGLHNRRYALEQMQHWVEEREPFVLTSVDIDQLKYCNDKFGHEEGNQYIIDVARALDALEAGVVCRVGGDEFFLLQKGIGPKEQDARLSLLREQMMQREGYPYPRSFSFGSCRVPTGPDICLEDYISLADTRMYIYKKAHDTKRTSGLSSHP